jgi:hypothetical protein
VKVDRIRIKKVKAVRIRAGKERGSSFREGNVWKKRTSVYVLRAAARNDHRAQRMAGSLPATFVARPVLHAATARAKNANERLTQRRGFLE